VIFFVLVIVMLAGCESTKKQRAITSFKIKTHWQFAITNSGSTKKIVRIKLLLMLQPSY
jgi:hypothetical protein